MCITKEELNKVVAEYRSMKALLDETESVVKGLADQIKTYMKENNLDKYIGTDYKLSYTTVDSPKWDSAKLKELLGDTFSNFQTPCSYPRLTVS